MYRKYIKKGFSLIEVMIAIFVIMVGIVGIYALVPHIVETVFANKDRYISAQLAREGFELVRNLRDNNSLAGISWDTGLLGCSNALGSCEIDYNDVGLSAPYAGNFLNINNVNGMYSYDADGTDTKYKRKITITNTEPNKRLDILVEILWDFDKSYVLAGRLYNWH